MQGLDAPIGSDTDGGIRARSVCWLDQYTRTVDQVERQGKLFESLCVLEPTDANTRARHQIELDSVVDIECYENANSDVIPVKVSTYTCIKSE
jgi:hypothetical protein